MAVLAEFIISIPVGSPANLNAVKFVSLNPKTYLKEISNSTRDVGENDGSEESEGIAVGFVVGLSDGPLLGLNETLGLIEGRNVAVGNEDGFMVGSTVGAT